jgi:amino acid adenylation domain-containing protein/FkbH-like protein
MASQVMEADVGNHEVAVGNSHVGLSGENIRALSICISSSFTADEIVRPLEFWMTNLGISAEISLAAYGQVLQEAINPASRFSKNRQGVNVMILRLEDWIRDRHCGSSGDQSLAALADVGREIEVAIDLLQKRTPAPLFVFLCGPSSSIPPAHRAVIEQASASLRASLDKVVGVRCLTHNELMSYYPVTAHENELTDKLGHVPYCREYFLAIASLLARRIAVHLMSPYKVLVIDCDNTLWEGVCGEDGVSNIRVGVGHRRFQEAIVRLAESGMLICLCSKNNIEDVEEVFTGRADMVLRKDHIVASRINWESKAANIESLSQELSLALDSFIFIDDSAVECAEVRARLPAVLTLQLPERAADIEEFVRHIWAFDQISTTREAQRRTAQYKENQLREIARKKAPSYLEFIASLNLRVDIAPMRFEELARVAELIQRTNQFNLTSVRVRAGEIQEACAGGALQCLVVRVSDRFGDYGLVGVVLYTRGQRSLRVENFVLSCRALGRGAEYRVLNALGSLAQQSGLDEVLLSYRPTARSAPALEFLDSAFHSYRRATDSGYGAIDEVFFAVPSQYAVNLAVSVALADSGRESDSAISIGTMPLTESRPATLWHEVAHRFSKMSDVWDALVKNGSVKRRSDAPYIPPRTHAEAVVTEIWADVLNQRAVGVRDNFFDLGGDSLLAVHVTARMSSALSRDVSLVELYEDPTVESLVAKWQGYEKRSLSVEEGAAVPEGSTEILPEMLRLIQLDRDQIQRIVQTVPGGSENVKDIYPLGPLQEGILFLHMFGGGGKDAYVLSVLFEVSSADALQKLQSGLRYVVSRHDALRTAVLWKQLPAPVQVVYRQVELPVDELVLDRSRDALKQLRERMQPGMQPIAIDRAPMMRLSVARDPDARRWFALLHLHHLVCDQESLKTLVLELQTYLEGCTEQLSDTLSYKSHVARAMAHALERDAEAFFRQKLGDVVEPTVPFGLTDVHGTRADIREDRVVLAQDLSDPIRQQARRFNVSAATLFHVAFGMLIARTSGCDSAVFGTVLMGRMTATERSDRMVGMFVNTLPLKLSIEAKADELVLHTHRELIALLNYDQASLSLAQRCSGVGGMAPLFSALLNYRHGGQGLEGESGVDAEWGRVVAVGEWTNYPLTVSIDDMRNTFILTAQTDSSIDPQRITGCLRRAIRSLVTALESDSTVSAARLPILPDEELYRIQEVFNNTGKTFGTERNIQLRFQHQVATSPASTAVICGGQSSTYQELNVRANRIARWLRQSGVQAGHRVAIYLERGIGFVESILGVLKAGAAYVPIDTSYPAERVAYICADSAPTVVITSDERKDVFIREGIRFETLEANRADIESMSGCDLSQTEAVVSPESLAYVVYTSGSTGRPKGVMVAHSNLSNLVDWHCSEFQLRAGDRSSNVAGVGFDATGWEIWPSLLAGGTLVIAPIDPSKDPERFLDWWSTQSLDVSFLPTPIAELSFALDLLNKRLRTLLVGGDRLNQLPRATSIPLVNNYGPTESTVVATSGEIHGSGNVIDIGKPIHNTRIYILDDNLQVVPIGVSGEIHIGGLGVARGYWNKPELTAERFIPDPYSVDSSSRMYKTGDLARWQENGTIEYLGRNDHQIKLRGFRIEPGEIEAQLLLCPEVREAVVIAKEDGSGNRRLVAYLTERRRGSLSSERLRNSLKNVLPEYMIPSAFVVLTELPLTANGKLDRHSLPLPGSEAFASAPFEEPVGELETALADIWRQLLNVEKVGRCDNFFDLGGHSILATRVVSRVGDLLDVQLPMKVLFDGPTVSDVAGWIVREISSEIGMEAV